MPQPYRPRIVFLPRIRSTLPFNGGTVQQKLAYVKLQKSYLACPEDMFPFLPDIRLTWILNGGTVQQKLKYLKDREYANKRVSWLSYDNLDTDGKLPPRIRILRARNHAKHKRLLACEKAWENSQDALRLGINLPNKLEEFLYDSYYLQNPKLYHDIKDCQYRNVWELEKKWDGRHESIPKLLETPAENRLKFTETVANYLHSKGYSAPWDVDEEAQYMMKIIELSIIAEQNKDYTALAAVYELKRKPIKNKYPKGCPHWLDFPL